MGATDGEAMNLYCQTCHWLIDTPEHERACRPQAPTPATPHGLIAAQVADLEAKHVQRHDFGYCAGEGYFVDWPCDSSLLLAEVRRLGERAENAEKLRDLAIGCLKQHNCKDFNDQLSADLERAQEREARLVEAAVEVIARFDHDMQKWLGETHRPGESDNEALRRLRALVAEPAGAQEAGR